MLNLSGPVGEEFFKATGAGSKLARSPLGRVWGLRFGV